MSFSDLTYSGMVNFKRYFQSNGLKDTTIKKYFKNLKTVVRSAINKKIIKLEDDPFANFNFRAKDNEMVCLNDDEFLRVVNLEFDTSKYNMFKGVPLARDMFLFSCYTGVRYSDLIKVSNKTIQFTEEGIYFNYVAQKTGKLDSINLRNRFPVKNEMYSRPEVLILKYKELLKFLPFKIALTTYNKHLKEVAKLANISQVLSSHVARRTFATHLVDKVGLMTMSNLMQHDDPQTTIKYFDKKKRMEEARLKNISWLGNDESD